MPSEEIDFDQAKPIKLAHEADPSKIVKFFEGEEPSPIQPKEITEEILARLYGNMQEAEQLAKLIAMDKKDVKELAGNSEMIQKGAYAAIFTHKKGQKKVKWDKLAKDMIGKLTDADLAKYTDEGEPTISMTIKKLG